MTIQEQFQEELRSLLGKYGVSISTEWLGNGDYKTIFFSPPEWEDVSTPVPFSGIDFGCRYFDKDWYQNNL